MRENVTWPCQNSICSRLFHCKKYSQKLKNPNPKITASVITQLGHRADYQVLNMYGPLKWKLLELNEQLDEARLDFCLAQNPVTASFPAFSFHSPGRQTKDGLEIQ